MKKKYILIGILFISLTVFSQKLAKVKGSKNVILSERVFDSISSLEIYKNLKINIIKSKENKLVIFADDNLHDIVLTDLNNGKLDIDLSNRISSKKKFEITLYLTSIANITLNDNVKLTNNDYLKNTAISVILNDKSEANLMLEAENITIEASNHAKAEMVLKADTIKTNLQETAKIKTTISCNLFIVNANQKSSLTPLGKVEKMLITAKNSAKVKATNLKVDTAELVAENSVSVYINATKNLSIKAQGKSKTYIYGNAKIDLVSFKNTASLLKKE